MNTLHLILLILTSLLFYSYIGYGIILWLMVSIKRLFRQSAGRKNTEYPEVTLVVAAFNEEDCIIEKIKNSLNLDYPKDKLQLLFVTDGSTDRTVELIKTYPEIRVEHKDGRAGKIAAVNRIMPMITTPITVFCDANTQLNTGSIKKLTQHFSNERVGAVAGEKRIAQGSANEASTAGEGIYWRYESKLKQLDSELNTVVGAAGELFAIRTSLYEAPSKDTLIEDFVLTMNIAAKGYKVVYEKEAYAIESGSAGLAEEIKRKIRIAAGGLQSVYRLRSLLVPTNPLLTFQYISHRVLRWTLAPLALLGVILVSGSLAMNGDLIGQLMLTAQIVFYTSAMLGYALEQKEVSFKILYIPLYFTMMNLCVFMGLWRLSNGTQSVVWDKAKRR